ncbi:bifunctional adenosylcobinamide kinase/adenosylcobinamide-phosphate guanylyltransferase [Hyphomicrobium zavarzinii]|jgi:adenosylcobinamide kinase/adenosylcobinamide-phosphate guanylyltransferase|uniref:bifunctional adenosylcobinamide kinase/adenosylcobinamide-phosphate guanylyltransferase n=1 Tax=Hyphomicrobium zavarzinii TaxID=48292 RepID=UPI0003643A5C|nr:bifunctional adenosylcobinamide kinase/adenosylcobinamide-phosphate guanylyltransferase [Hyphomicrobium zavarzinii]HML44865.1 bifunctional adenosylcobinamide kinase/adenosylcobinamide-phosphate guanylyltransferase [Hyphomicrobium zavarzinii]
MAAASLPRLTLVLGGARSGKSRFAEDLVTSLPAPWTYVATAEAWDSEMKERIAHHIARRGDGWVTREAPLGLGDVLLTQAGNPSPVLIDCLTLWLTNVMLAERDVAAERERLLDALAAPGGPVVVVSNEVGLGIVPDNALARAFRDEQGRLNAAVAQRADRVVLMAAGLPLTLKQPS